MPRWSMCLVLVVAFSVACYLPIATIRAPEFVFDDRRGILSNPDLRSDTAELWLHDYWVSYLSLKVAPPFLFCPIRLADPFLVGHASNDHDPNCLRHSNKLEF